MKKLFTLLFISTLFISCSQDNDVAEMEQEALSFEQKLAKGDFDNSNLGIYKGLFTTLDGQSRATIFITLNGISEPSVEFTFHDFTKAVVRSSANTNKGQAIKGMAFNEGDFDFTFKVNSDGSDPVMEDISYKGQEGEAVVVKETTKAPVTTKTGSYTCESGCYGDVDDTVPHPELGFPGIKQTFNFMVTGPGNSDVYMQFTLKRKVYDGHATQISCVPNNLFAITRCALEAQSDLNGRTGPFKFQKFNVAGQTAHHTYSTDPGLTCSTYDGTAEYRSTLFGRSTIAFRTDDPQEDGGDCL